MKELINSKNLTIYLIALLFGGGGASVQGLLSNPRPDPFLSNPRPDPFTGTEGKSFEKRVDSLEIRLAVAMNDDSRMRDDIDKCLALVHEGK